MNRFLEHLSEMLNLRPPPVPKRNCEFCGGVRCIGACGVRDVPGRLLSFSGRIVFDGDEFGHVVGDDGVKLKFRRGSPAEMALLRSCVTGGVHQIVAWVDEGDSPEILSVRTVDLEKSDLSE